MAEEKCPKCGSPLEEPTTTTTGRKLQRCSNGHWDKDERKNIGCDFVKWLEVAPETLDEKCPQMRFPTHYGSDPIWKENEEMLN